MVTKAKPAVIDIPEISVVLANDVSAGGIRQYAEITAEMQIASAIPSGSIITWADDDVPVGYFECNGARLNRVTYADLFAVIGTRYDLLTTPVDSFQLPDYRGYFLRAWDHWVYRDPDRTTRTTTSGGTGGAGDNVGTFQQDDFKSHTHVEQHPYYSGLTGSGPGGGQFWYGSTTNTGATGGNETRPINAYVMYCIKY